MSDQWQPHNRWLVPYPIFLRREPRERRDLVVQVRCEAVNPDYAEIYFATEAEAWAAARRYLSQAKAQAERDLAFLSRPYISPEGTEYNVPTDQIEAWKGETCEKLRIIDKGLSLCPPA